MRIGMAGITSLYWPLAIGYGLRARKDVSFVAAATLGSSDKSVKEHLGMSPQKYISEFGLKLYKDAEQMIRQERLDTVVLNVPHSEHARWTEKLAKLGVNIYIPKTFATTKAEADRIVKAGKKYGVQIASGPSERYIPAMLAAKKAVDTGLTGPVHSVRMAHHHGVLEVFHKNDWYRKKKEGGPELSLGWYVIDLAMYFTGAHAKSVFAQYDNYTTPFGPFMDCGKLFLKMDSGVMVSCDMYFCNRFGYPAWELELIGPKGAVKVLPGGKDPYGLIAILYNKDGAKPLPLPKNPPNRETAWVDGFKKGEPGVVPADRSREITIVSLAARQSARLGRPVTLPKKI